MNRKGKQRDLFEGGLFPEFYSDQKSNFLIRASTLQNWQNRVLGHQEKFFNNYNIENKQGNFFTDDSKEIFNQFNPLSLTALPLSFWRWSESPHNGPAIYLVMDQLNPSKRHILLYVGETISAEKRWKGEHDCKKYLNAYTDALRSAGLKSKLSIRFWTDVPKETKLRRKMEKKLIEIWLPPFNKESRYLWNTPFTAENS
tara:strand:+ start:65 stop:664 length:600 start_codon:yes stop_codon:yes gene_type:complete